MGGRFEPVCDEEGKFEPKQCAGKVCRCVDMITGEGITDSITYEQGLECRKGQYQFKNWRFKSMLNLLYHT